MVTSFWEQVKADGLKVPEERPLDEMTAELTRMLGDPDPENREGIARPTLATWIGAGVYDELLAGLGAGMAAGLQVGLGEDRTDTVFRRSFSALTLADCVVRDNSRQLLPADTILTWGDQIFTWFTRERDLRGFVPGHGWAHTVAHGADALAALACSPSMGSVELTVLLDVLADRLLASTPYHLLSGEHDRLARAAMQLLRRDLVGVEVLEPWLARLAAGAEPDPDAEDDPYRTNGNVHAFLRAVHLQLALAPDPPPSRADLLLFVIDQLRAVNATYLARPTTR